MEATTENTQELEGGVLREVAVQEQLESLLPLWQWKKVQNCIQRYSFILSAWE